MPAFAELLVVLANFAGIPTLFFQIVFSLESARSINSMSMRMRTSGYRTLKICFIPIDISFRNSRYRNILDAPSSKVYLIEQITDGNVEPWSRLNIERCFYCIYILTM